MEQLYLIGICENNLQYRKFAKEKIEKVLAFHNSKSCVYEFKNMDELKQFHQEGYTLDALFVNTIVDQKLSIKFLKNLKKEMPFCQIVFWSETMANFAEAYKVEHSFHVQMNQIGAHIGHIYNCLVENYKRQYERKLVINGKGKTIVLDQKEIQYLERFKRTTLIYLNGQDDVISTSLNLDQLHERINKNHFLRCHYSYIINLNYVEKYFRNMFVLSEGVTIPISRKHYDDAKNVFSRWENDIIC